MNQIIVAVVCTLLLSLSAAYGANPYFAPPLPHSGNVFAARFTADGQRTVSVDDSGALIEWDFLNKRILRRVQAPFAPERVALTRDASKAVFLDESGRAAVYDLARNSFSEIPLSLAEQGNGREAGAIAISDSGSVLFVADSYGLLYRSVNGGPFTPFAAEGRPAIRQEHVTALELSPDSSKLAVGRLGTISILDAHSGQPLRQIHHDRVSFATTITFSPDSRLITAGIPGRISMNHSQQELAVWEVNSGQKRLAVTSPDGVASAGGFSRDGRLALLGFSSSARIYDLTAGKQVGVTFKALPDHTWPWQMDMSPDGAYLLVSGHNGALNVFATSVIMKDERPKALARLEKQTSKVEALRFSPDGGSLLVSYESARPLVFDLKQQKLRQRLDARHKVSSFLFSTANDRLLAFGPYVVSQWQWPALAPLPQVEFQVETSTDHLQISPDGSHGVALTNNELIGNGFRRLPVLQWIDLTSGTVSHAFKLEELKDDIARFFTLGCVDFIAGTATVIDNDGRGKDDKGRRPGSYHSPDRALVYSLKDGTLVRIINAGKAEAGRFDCERMQFDWKQYPTMPELEGRHHYNYLETPGYFVRSEDGTVTVRDRKTGKSRRVTTFATGFTSWETGNHVIKMALSPDNSLLAIGTNQGEVGLYDLKTESWVGTFLYLGYGEWIWYTEDGIVNASGQGRELVTSKGH